ncbi:MAG: PIN domain-containing protein [Chloroflexota bacterium]
MSRYCLDTSAYSRFQFGESQVRGLIDGAVWIGFPAIALGELRAGFMQGRDRDRNDQVMAEFLANPVVEVLAVDDEVSLQYAEIVFELRRKGTPIPTNDIWIAATAARAGAIVLTYDDHFRAVTRVGSSVLEAER